MRIAKDFRELRKHVYSNFFVRHVVFWPTFPQPVDDGEKNMEASYSLCELANFQNLY